jgi:hypothetical protein
LHHIYKVAELQKIEDDFREKAVLVGLVTREQNEVLLDEYLDELAFLTETAGANPLKRFTQKLDRPDTKTFVGKGKLQEIVDAFFQVVSREQPLEQRSEAKYFHWPGPSASDG